MIAIGPRVTKSGLSRALNKSHASLKRLHGPASPLEPTPVFTPRHSAEGCSGFLSSPTEACSKGPNSALLIFALANR